MLSEKNSALMKKPDAVDSIEKVSIEEVYLVDANKKRLKRICGYHLTTKGKTYCKFKSGAGTTHPGIGYCSRHEKKSVALTKNFKAAQILKSGYGAECRERLVESDINKSLYDDFDAELEIYYSMLSEEFTKEKNVANLHRIDDILKQLIIVKKTRFDVQSRSLFTKEEVFQYVRIILDICRLQLDRAVYEKLLGQVQVVVGQKEIAEDIDYEEVDADTV